jgi:Tfp pilus assembly ATPase PilU
LTLCQDGKPTTLAAMVDLVNRSMHKHAVMIEDRQGFSIGTGAYSVRIRTKGH